MIPLSRILPSVVPVPHTGQPPPPRPQKRRPRTPNLQPLTRRSPLPSPHPCPPTHTPPPPIPRTLSELAASWAASCSSARSSFCPTPRMRAISASRLAGAAASASSRRAAAWGVSAPRTAATARCTSDHRSSSSCGAGKGRAAAAAGPIRIGLVGSVGVPVRACLLGCSARVQGRARAAGTGECWGAGKGERGATPAAPGGLTSSTAATTECSCDWSRERRPLPAPGASSSGVAEVGGGKSRRSSKRAAGAGRGCRILSNLARWGS